MLGFRVIGDCDKIVMPDAKVLFICIMKGMCIRLSMLIIIRCTREVIRVILCCKIMLYGIFCKSATYAGRCKNFAKKCFACLVGNGKSSTFAPAIEIDAAVIEILKVKLGSSNLLEKKLFEKFLRKSLVVRNKVFTFASAFENDSNKEEFFERFRYEQASSTILT